MCVVDAAIAFISLYVDDCMIVASNCLLQATKDVLVAKFNMTDLGEVSLVLGIKVLHNHMATSISLQQTSHINAILAHYSLTDCKPQYTPMTTSLSFGTALLPGRGQPNLSQATWPDIAFAMAYLSKFISRYNKSHWIAVKHIIQYLKATHSLSITYHWSAIHNQRQLSPTTYCNSDWGGNLNDHCSITGFSCRQYEEEWKRKEKKNNNNTIK